MPRQGCAPPRNDKIGTVLWTVGHIAAQGG
nr:MAG TPA: hypothetical protein [Caudoviricetes sp.]